MELVQDFWGGFKQVTNVAPFYLALITAGLWANRQFGASEEVRLSGAVILGLVVGVVLTYFGVAVTFPAWLIPLPLILLGIVAAIQSAQVNSRTASIVLLVIGVYLGYGQAWHGGQLATTVGIAIGAVTALAAGIGLGTVISATLGSFAIRVFGFAAAAIGVLILLDLGVLR